VKRSLFLSLSLMTMATISAEDQPSTAAATSTAPGIQPQVPAEQPAPETHDSSFGHALGASASLEAGYDSNAVLLPDNNPTASNKSGLALGADLAAKLRLIDQEDKGVWTEGDHGERLELSVDGSFRDYPSESTARLLRGGIHLIGHERESWGDPGFVLGYNHYAIDGHSAADATNGNLFASHINKDYTNVDIVTLGAEWLRYTQEPDKTGTYVSLGYSHWYLLESGNIHRRLEAGLAVDADHSRLHSESFGGVIPEVGAYWRFGSGQKRGTYDLAANVNYEERWYGGADGFAEKQGIAAISSTLDAWVCSNSTVGIYASWNHRYSNFDPDAYNRYQVGARLTALW
jgi:hypothetical protein